MSIELVRSAEPIACFGKLPGSGDFLRRGLPQSVAEAWDRWLQQGLLAAREALGEPWLDYYLVAPVWRFALGPGVLSDNAWLGLWLPSVDSVGRYFPFTVLAPLPARTAVCQATDTAAAWYEQTEALMHDLLQQRLSLDEAEREWLRCWPEHWPARSEPGGDAWALETGTPGQDPTPGWTAMADVMLNRQGTPFSVWWHRRQDGHNGAVLFNRGLPRPYACTALLDGQWRQWSWESL